MTTYKNKVKMMNLKKVSLYKDIKNVKLAVLCVIRFLSFYINLLNYMFLLLIKSKIGHNH